MKWRGLLTAAPLSAYGWDIGGSLLGIAGFTVTLCAAGTAPWLGRSCGGMLLLALKWRGPDQLHRGHRVLLGVQTFIPGFAWSPYYQIEVSKVDGLAHIAVNGIPHQTIQSAATLVAPFTASRTMSFHRLPARTGV